MALCNGNIYYGVYRGEFGGALYKLNITTGEWSKIENEIPFKQVLDLCPTPNGNLNIICSLSHLGNKYGRISTITPTGIENNWIISNRGKSDKRWEHEITNFSSLKFNKLEEQVLLTTDLGLLVNRNNKWIRLTPDWNNHIYVSTFLILNENEYLLGTYDRGAAILNIKDKTEKVILFNTSPPTGEGDQKNLPPGQK